MQREITKLKTYAATLTDMVSALLEMMNDAATLSVPPLLLSPIGRE